MSATYALTLLGIASYLSISLVAFWRRAQYEKGVVLKLDQFAKDFDQVTAEILYLRRTSDQHTELLARTVAQLEGLEGRVSRSERRLDDQ